MGYTHYWTQTSDFPPDVWNVIVDDAILLALMGIEADSEQDKLPLGNWAGEKDSVPEFTDDEISFNGIGSDACESFRIKRVFTPGDATFCKTGKKPYDIAVMSTLLIAYNHAPYAITITGSDGGFDDWLPAIALYMRVFNRLPQLPFKLRPKAIEDI